MRNKYLLFRLTCCWLLLCIIPQDLFSKISVTGPTLSFLTRRIQVLGDIPKDTVFIREFKFVNKGDAPLVIEEIHKSCSCSEYKINSYTIYPEEEGVLIITVDTKARTGMQEITLHMLANTKERDHIIKIIYQVQ